MMLEIAILNMGVHAVVTLVATAFIVAVIASYLIKIALILWHVIDRLVSILGALSAVAEEAQPLGSMVDDINQSLASGRDRFQGAVHELEERRAPQEEPGPAVSPSWSHWGA
jgi:hypothetical protein